MHVWTQVNNRFVVECSIISRELVQAPPRENGGLFVPLKGYLGSLELKAIINWPTLLTIYQAIGCEWVCLQVSPLDVENERKVQGP